MISRRSAVLLLCCCLPLSCSPHPDDITLQGSGATFPAPIYKRWFLEIYKDEPHVRINHQDSGPGPGVRECTEDLTQFGGRGSALSDGEIKRLKEEQPEYGGVLMVPM